MLNAGDEIAIERKTGYTTAGTFVMQNEEALLVLGTVGDNIGNKILVPWSNVDQIIVLHTPPSRKPTGRPAWMPSGSKGEDA